MLFLTDLRTKVKTKTVDVGVEGLKYREVHVNAKWDAKTMTSTTERVKNFTSSDKFSHPNFIFIQVTKYTSP